MKFDKSRVYTAVNADELKIGSKVICADTLALLKARVEHFGVSYNAYEVLREILPDDEEYRFCVGFGDEVMYAFAYFVERPDEHPFGKCYGCGYVFNSELRFEYDIKYCPRCGMKIDSPFPADF